MRLSSDETILKHAYINPHLTRAEAKAVYQYVLSAARLNCDNKSTLASVTAHLEATAFHLHLMSPILTVK